MFVAKNEASPGTLAGNCNCSHKWLLLRIGTRVLLLPSTFVFVFLSSRSRINIVSDSRFYRRAEIECSYLITYLANLRDCNYANYPGCKGLTERWRIQKGERDLQVYPTNIRITIWSMKMVMVWSPLFFKSFLTIKPFYFKTIAVMFSKPSKRYELVYCEKLFTYFVISTPSRLRTVLPLYMWYRSPSIWNWYCQRIFPWHRTPTAAFSRVDDIPQCIDVTAPLVEYWRIISQIGAKMTARSRQQASNVRINILAGKF